jgi:hypothetical protein
MPGRTGAVPRGVLEVGVGQRIRQQGAVLADAFGQLDQTHALALQAEGQPRRMRARDDAAQFIDNGAGHVGLLALGHARQVAQVPLYRTLLGHLRHESGHYFWDRLVATDPALLNGFRALFGDDRADYAAALQRHYGEGGGADWRDTHVSAYAAMHPWEDFAETWAHYLHIIDTLESAAAFGLKVQPRLARGHIAATIDFDPYESRRFDQIVDAWLPVEFATNSLNRSMGLNDLYPFLLPEKVLAKLGYIHALTHPPAALKAAV